MAKQGLLEAASGGTLLLDEVGECALRAQASLLRVLETKRVIRLGATTERAVDVRIVAATNRSLEREIEAQRFRSDLYYRLCAARVVVPPLRDRPLDIPVLARHFLEQAIMGQGRTLVFSDTAMQRLILHRWPGNVRELRNLIDYLVATVQEERISAVHLPETIAADVAPWLRVNRDVIDKQSVPLSRPVRAEKPFRNLYEEIRELEQRRIREALEATGGVRVKAAALIGIPLRTLVTKIGEYGLGDTPRSAGKSRRKAG